MSIQNVALAAKALDVAKRYLGVKEATGHNDGKVVNMFQEFVGGKAEHGAAWCAAFRSYCDHVAAEELKITLKLPKTDSSTELFHWAKSHGYLLPGPLPGCIGLLKGSGGTPGKDHCHTFKVISVDQQAGVVHSIDGNESNMVRLSAHAIDRCDWVACA
jgi:hypothetical protein